MFSGVEKFTFCCVCGKKSGAFVCRTCEIEPFPLWFKCPQCGSLGQLPCFICELQPLKMGRIMWFSTYPEGIHLVKKLKFENKFVLGSYIAKHILNVYEETLRQRVYDTVVLAPVSKTGFFARGVNHLCLIAAPIAKALNAKLVDPFVKRNDGKRETILLKKQISGLRILFIDDVLTTGLTLKLCLRLMPRSVKFVDALFFLVSYPHILARPLFRTILNRAWVLRGAI
ncbi:MAG: hypothetical protein NZT61_03390 [Deltaproteobacteria bacterium]|nr:hypothetical protein [Deltaproteobacteria bacterium]